MGCEVRTHEVTRRLGRHFNGPDTMLFPERDFNKTPHTIVTLAIRTQHRMTAMSPEMYSERADLHKQLVERMQAFREKLVADGRWCDFIDPASGAPFHSDSPSTFAEADERHRFLGFEMLELGCCRAVSCERF